MLAGSWQYLENLKATYVLRRRVRLHFFTPITLAEPVVGRLNSHP